jgi:hypothetical protein
MLTPCLGEENLDLQWTSQFLAYFLPSRNLSDLCLKIYFSQTYSNAEFIILNIALYCTFHLQKLTKLTHVQVLGGCIQPDCQSSGHCMDKEYRTLMSTCQCNLETALSQLSLYTDPSYEMTLALTLGVRPSSSSIRHMLTV